MNKKNLRHILQNADEAELERIASLTEMTDEKTRRRLQKAVQLRIQTTDHAPVEEEVYNAIPARRSFGTAFSAVAACLVIAGTAVGAIYLKHHAVPRLDPASQAGELPAMQETVQETEPETEQEQPAEFVTHTCLDYDMTDKMGVLGKMLNTVDFYRKVSGEFIRSESGMVNGGGVVTFEVDQDTWESYTKTVRGSLTQPAEDVLQGAAPDFAALMHCDESGGLRRYGKDACMYQLFENEDGAWYNPETNEARDPDEAPVKVEEVQQYWIQCYENNMQIDYPGPHRAVPGNAYDADECIAPMFFIDEYLFPDMDCEITGDITYIGRDCVVLKGNAARYEAEYLLYVDKATGFVLYFESRDSSGALLEWMRVAHIEFDEDAEAVPDALAGRSEWHQPEPTENPEGIPALWLAWGTNSHGQTYASCGQMPCDRSNYDQLPDLIRFGELRDEYGRIDKDNCFIKKTELFELFGDDPFVEMSRLMQEHEKTATAVPVAILNVYDIEGETVLYTVTYYDEP